MQRYQIAGMPCLVIVDPNNGEVIDSNAYIQLKWAASTAALREKWGLKKDSKQCTDISPVGAPFDLVTQADEVISFRTLCKHAAIVWIGPAVIAIASLDQVSCDGGGSIISYLAVGAIAVWAVLDELALLEQMCTTRYSKVTTWSWFQGFFDVRTEVAKRRFTGSRRMSFRNCFVACLSGCGRNRKKKKRKKRRFVGWRLPKSGVMDSVAILLAMSVLTWYDMMGKIFFIMQAYQCSQMYHLTGAFAETFLPVPLIGPAVAAIVLRMHVWGIALSLFLFFLVFCQGVVCSVASYKLSKKYKSCITDLAATARFACTLAVDRILNDMALRELEWNECIKQEQTFQGSSAVRESSIESRALRPGGEEEVQGILSESNSIIMATFRNMAFTFAVRVMGENLFFADLQASYLGLMFEHLTLKGKFLVSASLLNGAMTASYQSIMLVMAIPSGLTQLRRLGFAMIFVTVALTVHIIAKVVASFYCQSHLLNISQGGCFVHVV